MNLPLSFNVTYYHVGLHSQMIISVSQMLGNIVGLNNARFQESLSLINSYATSDKVMKGTGRSTFVYAWFLLFYQPDLLFITVNYIC